MVVSNDFLSSPSPREMIHNLTFPYVFSMGGNKPPIVPWILWDWLIWIYITLGSTTWRIIPFSKWLITMVSKSPNWGCSLYKWPKWLINGGYQLLTNRDDPPSKIANLRILEPQNWWLCMWTYNVHPSAILMLCWFECLVDKVIPHEGWAIYKWTPFHSRSSAPAKCTAKNQQDLALGVPRKIWT